MAKSIGV